eukprot:jgi/Tetstr1/427032/TSEL_017237.t1
MSKLGIAVKGMRAKVNFRAANIDMLEHVDSLDLQDHDNRIPDDLLQLHEGVHVNGKHNNIKLLVGGGVKIFSGLRGQCGCNNMVMYIYRIVGTDDERAMIVKLWRSACNIMRDIEEHALPDDWAPTELNIKLSNSKVGNSKTCAANSDLTAETWPGDTCLGVPMDNYVSIVQFAMK